MELKNRIILKVEDTAITFKELPVGMLFVAKIPFDENSNRPKIWLKTNARSAQFLEDYADKLANIVPNMAIYRAAILVKEYNPPENDNFKHN